MDELPINEALAAELENVDFGEDEVDAGGFYARVGDQPIGVRLEAIQSRLGGSIPSELATWLQDNFDLWLVPHRVSVIRRQGLAEPVSVGLEVEYLNGDRTCSILSLVPAFDYVIHGGVNFGMGVMGRLLPGGEAVAGEPQFVPDKPRLRLGLLELGLTTDAQVGFRYTGIVSTPRVSAVGIGSARCEWRFDKDKEPLFGRDIETWAAIALPCGQKQLAYRMRFYLVTRTFFFPTRRQSTWTASITCKLVDAVEDGGGSSGAPPSKCP